MTSLQPASMFDSAMKLYAEGNYLDAYRVFASVVNLEPQNATAIWHLGCALHQSKLFYAATLAFSRILALHPDEPSALNVFGWNLHLSQRTLEAESYIRKSISLNPNIAQAHMNLAQLLCYLGRAEEAVVEAKIALDMNPGEPSFQMSYGLCLMFCGRLAEGLSWYRARYKYKMPELLNLPYQKWDGRRCGTLFVMGEQGLGDYVQYHRFIGEAASRVDKVILYVGKELTRLAKNHCPENVEVVPMPALFPNADMWCPLLEVPVALGLKDEDFERFKEPYLRANDNFLIQEKIKKQFNEQLGYVESKQFKVGVVWSGNPANEIDSWRSMSLLDLLPLAEIPQVELYSLQIGKRQEDIAAHGLIGLIKDLSPRINDVQDTVDQCASLDLVITIDSSVAHISGAMGNKTWVVLNEHCADYRYARNSDQSEWYGAMRQFYRTLHESSWYAVIQRVKQALIEEVVK